MRHGIRDACIGKQSIYFFDNDAQALCEFLIMTESFRVLAVYDENDFDSSNIFWKNGFIYIASFQTTDLLKYDIKASVLRKISDYHMRGKLEQPDIYDYHMISNNKLWSFPNTQGKPAYYYDFDNGFFMDETLRDVYNPECKMNSRFSTGFENTYWKAFYKTNKYLKYDLQKQEVTLYEISDSAIQINSICFDGENLWAALADSDAVIKCTEDGQLLDVFGNVNNPGEEIFANLCCIDQYIIGVPRFGEYIMFLNKNLGSIKKIYLREINPEFGTQADGRSKILKCLRYKNQLLFWGFGIDILIITDIDGNNARSIPIEYTKEDISGIHCAKMIKNSPIIENKTERLTDFMSAIMLNNCIHEKKCREKEIVRGNKIHEVLGREGI